MKGCICHFVKWQIHPFIFCDTQWPRPPLFSPSWLIQWSMGEGSYITLFSPSDVTAFHRIQGNELCSTSRPHCQHGKAVWAKNPVILSISVEYLSNTWQYALLCFRNWCFRDFAQYSVPQGFEVVSASTRRSPNVDVMMGRRLPRQPIITSTSCQRLVLVMRTDHKAVSHQTVMSVSQWHAVIPWCSAPQRQKAVSAYL